MDIDDLGLSQSLFFQSGKERSAGFALSFAQRSARNFVLRLTGGCGNMTAADGIGMANLTNALRGRGKKGKLLPRFAGFAMFGGTRMVSIHDPRQVVPGITEIFPSIAPECPGTIMLGVVPGFNNIQRSRHPDLANALILSVESGKNTVTIVHPDLHSVLFVQPSPDRDEIWDDEYRECFRSIQGLHDLNWRSMLCVYNGGSVTRREVDLWAHYSLLQPGRWPILLVRESGRTADTLASDKDWLAAHPDVHVAENSVESINDKLYELGAVVDRADDGGSDGDTDARLLPFPTGSQEESAAAPQKASGTARIHTA